MGFDAAVGDANASGLGKLEMMVWPSFVGFTQGDPGEGPAAVGEPTDPNYQRGQIEWQHVERDGVTQIIGSAFVKTVKTSVLNPYTHQAFFSGPEGDCMVGKCQLEQPLPGEDGMVHCFPIENPDLRLNMRQGIDY